MSWRCLQRAIGRMSILLVSVCPCLAGVGQADAAGLSFQVRQCMARGWQPAVVGSGGAARDLLWKAPSGPWAKGAVIVLHGGGGRHFQWCVANAAILAPQARFAERAVAEGFAVFLLDSTDRVTDTAGRLCGKVWDDEVRERANLDLPFIGAVIGDFIPRLRPAASARGIFLTGLSSGGYMAVRAATRFNDRVAAVAPVSAGDPYGWHRICDPALSARPTVFGRAYDNETGRHIPEPGSCAAESYPNEMPWDDGGAAARPAVRVFRDESDGIVDASCGEKLDLLLRRHGYPAAPAFVLRGGRRTLASHFWQDAYTGPVLEFFAGVAGPPGR